MSDQRPKNQIERRPAPTPGLSLLPILAVFGILYLALAAAVRKWPLTRADTRVTRTLQSANHPQVERFMSFVSWFGFRPQSLILPLSVIYGFWRTNRRPEAVLLAAAWFSSMFSFLTKQVVRRPRPDANIVRVVIARIRDSSFPSGHVVHYVTFWGMVAYLLAFWSRMPGARWMAGLIVAPLVALVGPSRIYLGHHWFTDVLGSYLLGSAYLAGLIEVHRLVRSQDEDLRSDAATWTAGASQWLR